MKISVIDGYTENPGDLSWDGLRALGDVVIYDHSTKDEAEIIRRVGDAEIVVANKSPISRRVLDACPNVKYITVQATGYDPINYVYAREKGIPVSNVPTYGTASVAQFAIALLLEICGHAAHHSDAVHAGRWAECGEWTFWDYPMIELAGKTMGIIGFGRIGQNVGRIAKALGMRVIAYDARESDAGHALGVEYVTLDELFAQSDVLGLQMPLLPFNVGIINKENIAKMKDGAILINVGRGTTVDSDALVEALRSGRELECIYIQSGSPKGPVAAILNKAREQGIPVKEATREKLTQLSGIETHQGVAAICAAAAYAEMKDIYERAGEEPLFVVICDNIEDPHNLGAIIRTAEACGAHGVIIPKRHSAGLTAAAVKSSAGAAVCLPVVRVANIVATMQSLKAEKNVWFTCADMDGVNWCQLDFKGAVGLVIGSEGNGVSRLVKEECDFVAALPMQGQINSLNASVAGGIILYEITRQRLGLKAR